MAAIGGGTVVPTNWPGLIAVTIVIALVAAATYFGLEMTESSTEEATQTESSLSVQEVFSASARRGVEMAEPARALSRAAFQQDEEQQSSAADDWDRPMSDEEAEEEFEEDMAEVSSPSAMPAAPSKPAPAAQVSVAKASTKTMPREAEPKVTNARQRPSAEALDAWWKQANGSLKVHFAGTLDRGAKASDGIAVLFSEAVPAEQASSHLLVKDAQGKTLPAVWKSGANPTLLMVEGLEQGRYTLTIDAGVQGRNGGKLAQTVSGPVFVY